ncbi:hypothetical protein WN51_12123 [Melipona quadrifasciata]|uniref:Uncharacterized protein n=1 Tax=Melipona quadrifasciata TaxID=166423 RepID=A0A0N0BHM5_9HYME|nr:hypothetical protein WN51_12123 [Melipona quadrifasciata]
MKFQNDINEVLEWPRQITSCCIVFQSDLKIESEMPAMEIYNVFVPFNSDGTYAWSTYTECSLGNYLKLLKLPHLKFYAAQRSHTLGTTIALSIINGDN